MFTLFDVLLLLWQYLPGDAGDAASLLPTVLIHVLHWGSASFLADVVLLSVYIDSVEREASPR